MRVLLVSPEVSPFSKVGGLADVAGELPYYLADYLKVSVLSPLYKGVWDSKKNKLEEVSKFNTPLGEGKIFKIKGKNPEFFFVYNPDFYFRDYIYATPDGDYPDNHKRFGFLCFSAVENIPLFSPDLIHIHDWQTSLIPYLLKKHKNEKIKTLLTIHNMGYQGVFPKEVIYDLDIPENDFNMETFEFWGKVNFLKAGIIFSDYINAVSPQYAEEIKTERFGEGLDGVVRKYENKLCGIIDGIDYNIWNPQKDKNIVGLTESMTLLEWKEKNKRELFKVIDASRVDEILKVPVIGIVSRLVYQKGIDFLCKLAQNITEMGFCFVILGTGEKRYEEELILCSKKLKNFYVELKFDDPLARKIYAGSDFFIIPSRYEPCGLTQMIAQRYGTIPLASKVGGLLNTIKEGETGFLFDLEEQSILDAVRKALAVWKDKNTRLQMIKNAMSKDFSWNASAKAYVKLYEKIILKQN